MSYTFRKPDIVFVPTMFALGFLFWEWMSPRELMNGDSVFIVAPGFGVTLFFLTSIMLSLIWMLSRGIKPSVKGFAALCVILAGTLPFTLYDSLPIYFLLFLFEAAACILWVSFCCRTEVERTLSGFLFFDLIKQTLLVPFANFGSFFAVIGNSIKNKGGSKRFLAAIAGTVIALPLIAGVVALLARADDNFMAAVERAIELIQPKYFWRYAWEILLGFPVALYLFGLLHGNMSKRKTDIINSSDAHGFVDRAHILPTVAICTPMIILNAIYLLFFTAMSKYLLSGFGGSLPAEYSYAEYARRGFFELCAVAAINLFALGITWMFSKRNAKVYPLNLRFIGGLLSLLTLMLVAVAASKMVIYIEAYGLSRLRVYTLWFMAVLACIFILILIWHIHAFNAGGPIIAAVTILVLCLFLTNTDGIIANYNVDSYLKAETHASVKSKTHIDIEMIGNLSDAAVPALEKLSQNAKTQQVRDAAAVKLSERGIHGLPGQLHSKLSLMSFNLQSRDAAKRLG